MRYIALSAATPSRGGPPCAVRIVTGWQVLDEDLHEEHEDALLPWHRENPDQAVDHLITPPFGLLAVPSYVRWQSLGGRAVVGDGRTGQTVLFNHECLAIFDAVAASGGLAAANGRRLGVSLSRARSLIVAAPCIACIARGCSAPSVTGDDRSLITEHRHERRVHEVGAGRSSSGIHMIRTEGEGGRVWLAVSMTMRAAASARLNGRRSPTNWTRFENFAIQRGSGSGTLRAGGP